MTLSEILKAHPAPWRHVTGATRPGSVHVIDAGGNEVQLFTMLDFIGLVTMAMAPKGPPTAHAAPAAAPAA